MAKRRGLGRGLEALLGPAEEAATGAESLREIPIDRMRRGRYQPRVHIDPAGLEELASSIRSQGVVQPIVVRPVDGAPDDEYEIIAGERRWRAAQAAGLETIPAVVRQVGDDAALAMALIENIQREDLNAIEEASALSRFVEEFGLTHQEVADAIGRSRASVSNLIRLLDLTPEARDMVERGVLEMGQARALLGLSGSRQTQAARQVAARGLTARQTEELVRRLRAGGTPDDGTVPARNPQRGDPDVERLERELSDRLGAPVRIQHDTKGRGKLVIRFASLDEFEGLMERIH